MLMIQKLEVNQMAYCPKCGNVTGSRDVFCKSCGERLSRNMGSTRGQIVHGSSTPCPQCNGKGVEKCPKCGGKGEIKAWREINPEAWWWETCEKCDGEGTIPCRNNCRNGLIG